jgi:hypothetical protein
MKTKKPKTVKYPKNNQEAFDLIFKIARDFEAEAVILSKEDFDEHCGVENWTKADRENAIALALEEVCESVAYAFNDAIDKINHRKNLKGELK